jgi:hypothetical protein
LGPFIVKTHNRMELIIRSSLLVIGLLLSFIAKGQIGLKPLNHNPTIQSYLNQHPGYVWNNTVKHGKWGQLDTLHLPFFDDFTTTLIYPDSSHWQDNDVYVNQDFGVHPPSYGVATFDYLNANGKPHASIEKENLDYGDTLTSQFINLKADAVGKNYTLGDSIYVSFYYQAQGLGDFITENDSLKLLFKDQSGKWKHIWGVRGDGFTNFIQVLIPITDTKYLHEVFQIQFVNLTHRWGNNNHWHIDHVFVNTGRRFDDKFVLDYAIQSKPSSMLKRYYSMPYDHFKADVTEAADSFYFFVSNLQNTNLNTEVRYEDKQGAMLLQSTAFDENAANIPAGGYTERKVPAYNFTNLNASAYPVVVTRKYFARGKNVTNVPIYQNNDDITVNHEFTRHYAYDDGTPESGFGFNDLKTGDGRIVLAFDLAKADTLQAVDFMLTYNTQDVGRQRFVFQIYKDIEFNGGTDELVFERAFVGNDIYDGIDNRGFFTVGLDTPIVLPKGKFYVGWSQERNFNLTVGFDKNNGYIRSKTANQNIFFNIGDGWIQNNNSSLVGAPMIRPIVGVDSPWTASTKQYSTNKTIKVYPNPTSGLVHIDADIQSIVVLDLSGKKVPVELQGNHDVDLSALEPGMYFISAITKQNQRINAKVIKQ